MSICSRAQDIFTYNYRSADGLDTDIIKCITQDSLGFIWIGADDGLYRFDGINFNRYAEGAPSNFFKDFLTTSDGKLLGIHDMGITIINPGVNDPSFEIFLPGNREVTDTALWFPKHAYEDSNGIIWIAEPQSVVKYENGSWKRFNFGSLDNTISFVRSFNFVETNDHKLIAISNTGNYYYYNNEEDTFQPLEVNMSFFTYDIKQVGDRTFLATGTGIKEIIFSKNRVNIHHLKLSGIENQSEYRHIEPLDDKRFVISGVNKNTSIVDLLDLSTKRLVSSEMFVNQSFTDQEGNIWLSTQKGVLLITLPEFRQTRFNGPNNYLEALITSDSTENIYALRSNSIWKINKSSEKGTEIISGNDDDYFLSGVYVNDHLYVSSAYRLLKIENGNVVDHLDLINEGRYIFDVVYDQYSESLWISQEAYKGIRKVNPLDLSYTSYSIEKGLTTEITGLKVTEDGVYALSSNPDHYLYFKPHASEKFQDLSIKFPEPYRIGLALDDMVQIDNMYLLATNYGLFSLDNGNIAKVHINLNFDNSAVRGLLLEDTHLWIATTSGLIRYNMQTHDYAQYSETSGLPVNTVNKECLIINDNKLWVGTSQGIAVTDYNPSSVSKKTKEPIILSVVANGKKYLLHEDSPIEVPFESFITVSFTSLLFPAKDMEYSYKINEQWSPPKSTPEISLSLPDGEHKVEIRAKKVGNFGWSDTSAVSFIVKPPFYKTSAFILAVFLILGIAVFATRFLTTRISKRRQDLLTLLVEERTQELNKIKDQLEVMVKERTNELEHTVTQLQETQDHLIQAEKMASLGVLTAGIAHEINNPVNYLQGGLYSLESILNQKKSSDDEELDEVMSLMKLGIHRITTIVKGLSRYSRESDHSIKPCNLHEVIHSCLVIMEHELKGRIALNLELDAEHFTILADEGNIHQLLVNLVSNAAHAIENEGVISIKSKVVDDLFHLTISDSGSGIDEAVLDKIFDPFYTTKAPGRGTGLGLYISKKIISEHQGEIHFQSKTGEGTSVLVTFKLMPNGSTSEKEDSIRR